MFTRIKEFWWQKLTPEAFFFLVSSSKSRTFLPLAGGPRWCRCSSSWWSLLSRKSSRTWYDPHLHRVGFVFRCVWIFQLPLPLIKLNWRCRIAAPTLCRRSLLGVRSHCVFLFVHSITSLSNVEKRVRMQQNGDKCGRLVRVFLLLMRSGTYPVCPLRAELLPAEHRGCAGVTAGTAGRPQTRRRVQRAAVLRGHSGALLPRRPR